MEGIGKKKDSDHSGCMEMRLQSEHRLPVIPNIIKRERMYCLLNLSV